jgi:anthranilate/para-aminobenzoate synthase component II
MSDKIIIIDFEDSFTYNIANILFSHERKISVLPHREFFTSMDCLIDVREKIAVILGPGPGS